ncbi:MAG: hypothetical protein M4D80_12530 [Myxococcota bacterium]|nr:hypothetical protein [Myxococcota bacterium]
MRWLLVFAIACSKPPVTAPRASWPDLQPLAGAWTGTSDGGATVDVTFRPIARGSALAETFGKPGRETMTLYHADSGGLVATHYCAQGNQPRLRARQDGKRFVFTQAEITDLDRAEPHLVEMEIVLGDNVFARVEVYRAPDGTLERTRWHFVRVTDSAR